MAQAVAGSVWGEDAVEAFLFVYDPLDSPQSFELCRDLSHVFGGNEVCPDDAEFSWWLFRHPAILPRKHALGRSSGSFLGSVPPHSGFIPGLPHCWF
jgi:hypothetical protein